MKIDPKEIYRGIAFSRHEIGSPMGELMLLNKKLTSICQEMQSIFLTDCSFMEDNSYKNLYKKNYFKKLLLEKIEIEKEMYNISIKLGIYADVGKDGRPIYYEKKEDL